VGNWKETPATVVWSTVRKKGEGKHTNHQADICYEYHAAGKTWRNNRLRPGNADGSRHAAARKLVSAHPPGSVTSCWIHPTKPERAVLSRSPGWAIFLTLFPLPFLIVGLMCARLAIRNFRKAGK
jgi:hypothetical protein